MTDQIRLHAFVRGKVQAVRFRVFTLDASSKYQLTGWVRNRFDRSVELIAEGEREDLEKFLELLKTGPSLSNVENIEREWLDATGEYKKFRIRMSR
jgi:acylphosphatase